MSAITRRFVMEICAHSLTAWMGGPMYISDNAFARRKHLLGWESRLDIMGVIKLRIGLAEGSGLI